MGTALLLIATSATLYLRRLPTWVQTADAHSQRCTPAQAKPKVRPQEVKAALNHAWRNGAVPSDDAWHRVKPFNRRRQLQSVVLRAGDGLVVAGVGMAHDAGGGIVP